MRGVLFANPAAGQDRRDDPIAAMLERVPDLTLADSDPVGLAARIDEARASGVDYVAVAGGDGTVRSVAEHLVDGDLPLLVVPAGTRNHFAKAVGTGTLDEAVAAVEQGRIERVQVGEVNGRIFLNNLGVGAYPRLVTRRERHEDDGPKWVANLKGFAEEFRHARRVRLSVDGEPFRKAWLAFVGNGQYGSTVFDLSSRESLDDGVLDVAVAEGRGRFSRARLAGAVLRARIDDHELFDRRAVPSCTVRLSPPGRVLTALDGEVFDLPTPLEIRSRPRALAVLVPDRNPSATT